MSQEPDRDDFDETQTFDFSNDDVDDAQPKEIGRYRIERVLGKGGFGVVYLASDKQLDRLVAIKVPHPRFISKPQFTRVYVDEARNVAGLDHPNIVPVYDVGNTDKYPCFIVSKYIEGVDLSTRIKSGRLSFLESCQLTASIAGALHFAHKKGLVHRDVKPGNILIDNNGTPFIVDFGLALSEDQHYDSPRVVGTPSYMSPEQIRGEGHRVDGRSDIFSLGIVLYELLTGRRPFRGPKDVDLFEQITEIDPWPLRQHDEKLPVQLERICFKALEKRASNRYSSAFDFAEDIQHFLDNSMSEELAADPDETRSGIAVDLAQKTNSPSTEINSGQGSSTQGESSADSNSHPSSNASLIKIIPKGLRAFDAHDADFFIKLLPGPTDRLGIPDSVRFWKQRIEDPNRLDRFSVGMIYGPSGCGKSSFVRAGLLPLLPANIKPIYIEATPKESESRILNGLKKQFPELESETDLVKAVARIRHGQVSDPDAKALLVIDQFEQWLHSNPNDSECEMVRTLRQCDGKNIQCLLLVRDDFWLAASRLMRELEIPLVEGENIALVDLFDKQHAKKVLIAFGRAFERLPDEKDALTKQQKEFVDKSVEALAQDDKIICVRLALFAEMMKGKDWLPSTLQSSGGISGVGVTFLEETFSAAKASPSHRFHQKAIRKVLQALLPKTASNIKGQMKSVEELQEASGYKDRTRDFEDLIRILDNEVRLITPTDPEGTETGEDSDRKSSGSRQFYQLTHDYLVPSIRNWLTTKQKETKQGRAMLRLGELADAWNAKPENRFLPTLMESVGIRLATNPSDWSDSQATMMNRARKFHGTRLGLMAGVVALVAITASFIWASYTANQERIRLESNAVATVNGLVNAEVNSVQAFVDQITPENRKRCTELLYKEFEQTDNESKKLNVGIALASNDDEMLDYVFEKSLSIPISDLQTVTEFLQTHSEKVTEKLWTSILDQALETDQRFHAAAILANLSPKDSRWSKVSEFVANYLTSSIPAIHISEWMKQLENVNKTLNPHLKDLIVNRQIATAEATKQRSNAAMALARYLKDAPQELLEIILYADQYEEFRHLIEVIPEGNQEILDYFKNALENKLRTYADEIRDAHWKKQAIAAVALSQLGAAKEVWPYLKHSSDPSLRSFIIRFLAKLKTPPDILLLQLVAEKDISIQRALILAIGGQDLQRQPKGTSSEITKQFQSMVNHSDPGIHAAIEWSLRRWNVALPTTPRPQLTLPDAKHNDRIQALKTSVSSIERQLQAAEQAATKNTKTWLEDLNARLSSIPAALQTDLVIHFKLDEESGNQADNSANAEEPGVVTGKGESTWETGVIGNGIELKYSYAPKENDQAKSEKQMAYVQGTDSFSPKADDSFSLGCWIFVKEDEKDEYACIMSKMDRDSAGRGFDLWFERGRIGVHVKNSYPDRWLKAVSEDKISLNAWHHVFATYDGSGRTTGFTIYVDGKKVVYDIMADTLTGTIQNDVPFIVGARGTSLTESENEAFPLNGRFDDVRVYKKLLNESDVKSIFHLGIKSLCARPEEEISSDQIELLNRVRMDLDTKVTELRSELSAAKQALQESRWDGLNQWYENKAGQTMVVIPPPIGVKDTKIDYYFAIGSKEISEEQFRKMSPSHGYEAAIAPFMDCPAHQVSWFDAARYCNWLSELEGIEPGQFCYVEFVPKDGNNTENKYKSLKLRTNYRKLKGYRLPTADEWQLAAAADSKTKYHFGEPLELLSDYGWYGKTSQGTTYPVGSLMPNDFGLFDIQGNLWEWTLRDNGYGNSTQSEVLIKDTDTMPMLGGCFRYTPLFQRSEDTFDNMIENRSHEIGFRVVRTLTTD